MVVGRTFLRHPCHLLLMCNSRRTFETGFIAARLPWTSRLYARIEPEPLLGGVRHPADREPSLFAAAHQLSRGAARVARRHAARRDPAARDDNAARPGRSFARRPLEARALYERAGLDQAGAAAAAVPARSARKASQRHRTRHSRDRRERTRGRDVLHNAGGRFQPRRPHAPDARRHRRAARAVCTALALRHRLRPVSPRPPFDALSRACGTKKARIVGTVARRGAPVTTSALLASFCWTVRRRLPPEDAVRAMREQLDALADNAHSWIPSCWPAPCER